MIEALNAGNPSRWLEEQARTWTLLRQSYDEVVAAARYIFRHEPVELAQFSSLYNRR